MYILELTVDFNSYAYIITPLMLYSPNSRLMNKEGLAANHRFAALCGSSSRSSRVADLGGIYPEPTFEKTPDPDPTSRKILIRSGFYLILSINSPLTARKN